MPKITEMYAFICEDTGPEDEGVVAENFGGVWMPLVGADMARAESLKPLAQMVARKTGKPVKLIHFTNREELGIIEPKEAFLGQ